MTHSDDQGLVLPPKLAPIQVVIVPIYKTDEQRAAVAQKAEELQSELSSKGLFVKFDNDDTKKPGWKFAEHEMKGVPVRIAIGPRDLENQTAEVARRDTGVKESISFDSIVDHSVQLMTDIQENLFQKALEFRERETREASTYEEFKEIIKKQGGFVKAHWDGTAETEERIKKETSATIRCIPLDDDVQEGKCMVTGQPSAQRVIFAKAY
jgi:prolyl-tRNA synthetase